KRTLHRGHTARQLMGHRSANGRELRKPAALAVVTVKGQQSTMVILPGGTEQALTAGFDRLNGDTIAAAQVLDAIADFHDFTAQLVTQNDWILDPSQRVRRIARGNRSV